MNHLGSPAKCIYIPKSPQLQSNKEFGSNSNVADSHMVSMFAVMIVSLAYLQYMILGLAFALFLYHFTKSSRVSWNLPLVGMLPAVLLNVHKLHDKVAEALEQRNGSFLINGAWLAQRDIFLTSDPANVQHILSTNFSGYHKGPEVKKRFDIFGDSGLFNSDFEDWKHQRKLARGFISHQKFQQLMTKIIPDIIEKGLIPVLEHVSEQESVVDLRDLLQRNTYDFACTIATGHNPNSLRVGFPEIPFTKAIDDACEAILVRHLVPESLWRLQSWLGIGKERKLSDSWKTIDQFWAELMSIKQENLKAMTTREDEESFNLLNCYLTGNEFAGPTPAEKVMRDNITGLVFATEGTSSIALSWFFWFVSKNPLVEMKIREELRRNLSQNETQKGLVFHSLEQLNKLVYLHASLCETLRLCPPVPFQIRIPVEGDILPSGHHVNQKTNVLISAYAMGRMESIWGEDCHDFKPERWITEEGGIKHEPAHKFFAFNAGPRICPGKDIAFTLMKAIAATILHNYHVQVLESQPVIPDFSISFRMKHSLMARVKNISA